MFHGFYMKYNTFKMIFIYSQPYIKIQSMKIKTIIINGTSCEIETDASRGLHAVATSFSYC